jgi:hypothetical protein
VSPLVPPAHMHDEALVGEVLLSVLDLCHSMCITPEGLQFVRGKQVLQRLVRVIGHEKYLSPHNNYTKESLTSFGATLKQILHVIHITSCIFVYT